MELCWVGCNQPPAWREDRRAAVFPSFLLCPAAGTVSRWGIKSGPSAHSSHSTRQEAKRALARPSLLGRSAGLHTLCWGITQREALPIRKGRVQAGMHRPMAGAGCWAAALILSYIKPQAAPSRCPELPFTCTVSGSGLPGVRWVPSITVPPKTKSLHPHAKFQPARRSLF